MRVCVCMYVYVVHMSTVFSEARRKFQIPWSWTFAHSCELPNMITGN